MVEFLDGSFCLTWKITIEIVWIYIDNRRLSCNIPIPLLYMKARWLSLRTSKVSFMQSPITLYRTCKCLSAAVFSDSCMNDTSLFLARWARCYILEGRAKNTTLILRISNTFDHLESDPRDKQQYNVLLPFTTVNVSSLCRYVIKKSLWTSSGEFLPMIVQFVRLYLARMHVCAIYG